MNHGHPSSHTFLRLTALTARRRALDRAARQALPSLADFCLVHVVSARALHCVAAAHSLRRFAHDLRTVMTAHRIRRDDLTSTVAAVVRGGRPTLRTAINADADTRSRDAMTQLNRRLAATSVLVVPVKRDGALLGTLSLCYSQSGRSHAARHVAPAERLAVRIAHALTLASNAPHRVLAAARDARQAGPVGRRLAARN
jgi:GAF domain-containing protein